MTSRNNSRRPALWPYGFGVVAGIGSFSVTRGVDGELFGCADLFSAFAVAYRLAILLLPVRATVLDSIGHLFWGELCAIVGMSLDSQLEEMAGMLYLDVRAATAIAFIGGMLMIASRKRRVAESQPSEERTADGTDFTDRTNSTPDSVG